MVMAMARAYTLSEIFPLHHPALRDALVRACDAGRRAGGATLHVSHRGLAVDDEVLVDHHGHLRAFARDLRHAGVTALEFPVDVDREEIERLMSALRETARAGSFECHIAEAGGSRVAIGFHGVPATPVTALALDTVEVDTHGSFDEPVGRLDTETAQRQELYGHSNETEEASDDRGSPEAEEAAVEGELEQAATVAGVQESWDEPEFGAFEGFEPTVQPDTEGALRGTLDDPSDDIQARFDDSYGLVDGPVGLVDDSHSPVDDPGDPLGDPHDTVDALDGAARATDDSADERGAPFAAFREAVHAHDDPVDRFHGGVTEPSESLTQLQPGDELDEGPESDIEPSVADARAIVPDAEELQDDPFAGQWVSSFEDFEQVAEFRAALGEAGSGKLKAGTEALEADLQPEPERIEDVHAPDVGPLGGTVEHPAEAVDEALQYDDQAILAVPVGDLAPDSELTSSVQGSEPEGFDVAEDWDAVIPIESLAPEGEAQREPPPKSIVRSAEATDEEELGVSMPVRADWADDVPEQDPRFYDPERNGQGHPDLFDLARAYLEAVGEDRLERERDLTDAVQELQEERLDEAVDGIHALLAQSDTPEREALEVARLLSSPSVVDRLVERLGSVRSQEDRERHMRVARFLAEYTAPAIARALSAVPQRAARRNYMDALFKMEEQAQKAALPMLEDSRWFIVRNGVDVLAEVGGVGVADKLMATLAHPDHRVRKAAILALAKLGCVEAGPSLLAMLEDEQTDVREAATMAVGHLKIDRAMRPLMELLDREKDEDLQLAILRSLGQIGDPSAVPAIEKRATGGLFSRRSTAVRISAYRALAAMGTPHATELIERATQDRNAEVASAARGLIGRM